MGALSAVAAALGRGVERFGSGRAALAYYRTVLANTADPAGRAAAFLAAVRIGIGLRDRAVVAELVPLWATVPAGTAGDVVAVCKDLARAGMPDEAAELAGLEARRARSARALYLWARSSRGPEAAARYAETIARATSEGAGEIVAAARRRRAELLAQRWETLAEAVAEASAIDLGAASPGERLAVAAVLLRAPSRFVRATALGALDELVTTERADGTLAARALHLAAGFADEAGPALTPLEVERLTALFGRPYALLHAPAARATLAALATLGASAVAPERLAGALAAGQAVEPGLAPLHARARDIAGGRFEPPHASMTVPDRVLDAAAAVRDAAKDGGSRAAHLLRELATVRPCPRPLLGIAHAALVGEHAELRASALTILAAHLESPTATAPPRGWTALAAALLAAGAPELAERARFAALAAREPGANDALVATLTRAAWDLFAHDDRPAALAKLREARSHARKP